MGAETIEVYARIRPSRVSSKKKKAALYKTVDYAVEGQELHLRAPKVIHMDGQNVVSSSVRERYKFKCSEILDMEADQDYVFGKLGKPVVESVLTGYNGTIFAYGQSGSGKTYTMTGAATAEFSDRGIIPRAIGAIFDHIENRSDIKFTIRISYIEIYKGEGYDLLDPNHEPQRVQDLPKVVMQADERGEMNVKNLNSLPVAGREDALNLLFNGDANRMICETANNELSSRSHCIFSVFVEQQRLGSSKIRKSKLNLVDLAGSERTKTTAIQKKNGRRQEVSNVGINLSLHCLANVIVALHEQSQGKRDHIPYRNSLLTLFLKDSLGGNCKTVMVATMSMENTQVQETISTCRFAERVAMIPNTPAINEEFDPHQEIRRLKEQLQEMRIREAEGTTGIGGKKGPLTDEEKAKCKSLVDVFLSDPHEEGYKGIPRLEIRKTRYCFELIRNRFMQAGQGGCPKCGCSLESSGETKAATSSTPVVDRNRRTAWGEARKVQSPRGDPKAKSETKPAHGGKPVDLWTEEEKKIAYDEFCLGSEMHQAIAQSKANLKVLYAKAKGCGAVVMQVRGKVMQLKESLEKFKREREEQETAEDRTHLPLDARQGQEEKQAASQLSQVKQTYKEEYQQLKRLKGQIELLEKMVASKSKVLVKQFSEWCESGARVPLSPRSASVAAEVGASKNTENDRLTREQEVEAQALAQRRQQEKNAIKRNLQAMMAALQTKRDRARALGLGVNASRDKIIELKENIKQARIALKTREAFLDSPGNRGEEQATAEMVREMDAEKAKYKQQFKELTQCKEQVQQIEQQIREMQESFREFDSSR